MSSRITHASEIDENDRHVSVLPTADAYSMWNFGVWLCRKECLREREKRLFVYLKETHDKLLVLRIYLPRVLIASDV